MTFSTIFCVVCVSLQILLFISTCLVYLENKKDLKELRDLQAREWLRYDD